MLFLSWVTTMLENFLIFEPAIDSTTKPPADKRGGQEMRADGGGSGPSRRWKKSDISI